MNKVDCSPFSPLNRVCGSILNLIFKSFSRATKVFQSEGVSIIPKCFEGTALLST